MAKNTILVPQIRFPEFTDAWEQRKLSDIGDIITGTTPPTKDKDNYGGDRLFVSPADIQGNRYVTATNTTLTDKGYALGRELRGGTSLFVSIGSTIGKVAQIKDSATTNQQINAVVPYDEMNDDFVFTMLENESDKIKKMSAQQAVPIINKTTFGDTEIKCPQKDEQIRIGRFFSDLDNLITLHQRRCDTYKKMKKGIMQKLFNQEVRFKKDDGSDYADWEEKSLGDLLQYEQPTKYIVASDDYTGCSKYPVLTAGKSFILGYTDETDGVYKKGDVIIFDDFTCDSKYVDFKFKVKSSAMKMLTTVNPYHSLKVIFELMNRIGFKSLGHQRHWISIMSQEAIIIPSDIEEQTKIANCLFEYDALISASEQKVEAYKKLKKAMLQKMFV